MTRSSFVYDPVSKTMVNKDQFRLSLGLPLRVSFLADLPDFVSPIDGKLYSGRAGLREHNKRHDVVSNADLVGLPTLTNASDQRSSEQRRSDAANRKQLIINEVSRHYR